MGRHLERGQAALWVIGVLAVSIAAGVGVYLVIKDQRVAAAAEARSTPVDPDPAPTPPPVPAPVEPAPDPVETPVVRPTADSLSTEDMAADHAIDPTSGMLGTPGVDGGLVVAAVMSVVEPAEPRLTRCFEQRVAAGAKIDGVMRVVLTINRRGGVDSAEAQGLDDGLGLCVAGVLKSLRFGRTSDGETARIVYPLGFHGLGTTGDVCDEVSCVLDDYQPACCARFKKPRPVVR